MDISRAAPRGWARVDWVGVAHEAAGALHGLGRLRRNHHLRPRNSGKEPQLRRRAGRRKGAGLLANPANRPQKNRGGNAVKRG